jgi:hypothetical protein
MYKLRGKKKKKNFISSKICDIKIKGTKSFHKFNNIYNHRLYLMKRVFIEYKHLTKHGDYIIIYDNN